jgi:hypothetical protein
MFLAFKAKGGYKAEKLQTSGGPQTAAAKQ